MSRQVQPLTKVPVSDLMVCGCQDNASKSRQFNQTQLRILS